MKKIFLGLCLILVFFSSNVFADRLADLEEEIAEMEKKVEDAAVKMGENFDKNPEMQKKLETIKADAVKEGAVITKKKDGRSNFNEEGMSDVARESMHLSIDDVLKEWTGYAKNYREAKEDFEESEAKLEKLELEKEKLLEKQAIEKKVKEESKRLNGIIPLNDEAGVGTKIVKGEAELKDIPRLILYWIDYLTYLAGTICVIMIIVGGFQYMIGGITDDKDQGKKTIQYAIIGLIVTFTAWVVVDFVQRWITAG